MKYMYMRLLAVFHILCLLPENRSPQKHNISSHKVVLLVENILDIILSDQIVKPSAA